MEALLFLGGVIVMLGGIWTVQDLLEDAGLLEKNCLKRIVNLQLRHVQLSNRETSAQAPPAEPAYDNTVSRIPSG